MIADIQFQCVHCGQLLAVEPSGAGQSLNCPACEREVTVPEPTSNYVPRFVSEHVAEETLCYTGREGAVDHEAELISVRKSAGQLAQALRESREENVKLQKHIDRMEAERDSLSQVIASLQGDLQRMDAQREALRNDLDISRQRVVATENHLNARERELGRTQQLLAAAEGDSEALRSEVERFNAYGDALRQQLEEANVALDRAAEVGEELLRARQKIEDLEAKLNTAGHEQVALFAKFEELQQENATLRRDLAESEMGREVLELRGRLKDAEEERNRAVAVRIHAEADAARATSVEGKLRSDIEKLLKRCEEAERQAEAVGEARMQKDNDVLRDILARQKEELAQKYTELSKLRRANLGVRMVYGLVSLAVIGLIALVVRVLPLGGLIGG